MDDIDRIIIKLIQDDPGLTHSEIAKKIRRSQPTVGQRIKKLQTNGLIKYQAGFNFKELDMQSAYVYVKTTDVEYIVRTVKNCPHMINAFRLSGEFTFSILVIAFAIKDIELIVNYHFRKNPNVENTSIELITGIVDDLILHLDLDFKQCKCRINHLLTQKE